MTEAAIEQLHRYPYPSTIADGAIRLAAMAGVAEDAAGVFFAGRLEDPHRTAQQLRALMTVVAARHHLPAAMLEKILRETDPVVTANDDILRFEGFSGCCGAYARVDLLPAALGDSTSGRGTTNVDFNPTMLAALARIKRDDDVTLAVSGDAVALTTGETEVIEKKVRLPLRWLRGFVEVQAVQSRMQQSFDIDAVHALRFLRSLPRMKTNRRTTWIHPSGAGLRLSQVARPDAIAVGGLERLRNLEPLVSDARRLVVYNDSVSGATAWVLHFGDSHFTLVLSPEVWRGFSGEGQGLSSIAAAKPSATARVRAQLAWQNTIDPEVVATATGLTATQVEAALEALGTQGLVGYDLVAGRYFRRELPFDLTAVAALQPRLAAARKLVGANAVRVTKHTDDGLEAFVASTGVEHRVTAIDQPQSWTCTCPWFAKHEETRGPCKHVLATQIVTDT